MKYPFRNLVFEGGGVKGIAYVGAMKVLGEKGILDGIERVGGTSAGAINALLFALGYTLPEMDQILFELDFNKFKDDSWGFIRDTKRFLTEFGWYKGAYFRDWVGRKIRDKAGGPNATFSDLKAMGIFRDVYFVGTNLSTGFAEVFSAEHTPNMQVRDAVRISMSIPLFFAAVRSPRGHCYVDGGLINNYPVKLFDRQKYVRPKDRARHVRKPDYYQAYNRKQGRRKMGGNPLVFNKETLGFRLDTKKEIAVFRDGKAPQGRSVRNIFRYAMALAGTILEVQASQHIHGDDWQRTLYIDTLDVKTTDFDLSDERKRALVASGERHARRYLDWFEKTKDVLPVNHPSSRK